MRFNPSDSRKKNRIVKSEKILIIIAVSSLSAIILLSIYATIISPANGRLFVFLKSPLYITPWMTLAAAMFVYPVLTKRKERIRFYILTHYPAVLLLLTAGLSFYFSGQTEIALKEGERIQVNEIYNLLSVNKSGDQALRLDRFEIERYPGRPIIKSYQSDVTLINGKTERKERIAVNAPLKINGLFFFQKSWGMAPENIILEFNGWSFSLADTEDKIIKTPDGKGFRIYPVDLIDGQMVYHWDLYSKRQRVLSSGPAVRNGNELVIDNTYTLTIRQEKNTVISVFEVRYNPLRYPLAAAALLFLAALTMAFLVRGKND